MLLGIGAKKAIAVLFNDMPELKHPQSGVQCVIPVFSGNMNMAAIGLKLFDQIKHL